MVYENILDAMGNTPMIKLTEWLMMNVLMYTLSLKDLMWVVPLNQEQHII